MFASGADSVFFQLKGHTDMNPVDVEIELTTFEVSDPTSTSRLVNIDEASGPSEISDYIDANSTLASETTAVKAVTDAIPESGAMTSIAQEATLDNIAGTTFDTATDSLEAIRDRGDAEWVTGAGGSSPTVEEIRTEMDDNSTKLATIIADLIEMKGATFTEATDSLEAIRDRGDAEWTTDTGTIATAVWNFIVENDKSALDHLVRVKAILGGNTQSAGKEFMDDIGTTIEASVTTDISNNRTWN
jgi:hypothetical protein